MEPALPVSPVPAVASPPPSPPAPAAEGAGDHWNLAALAGRVCELGHDGATPRLSFTAALVREAQQQGQPVAWIQAGDSGFYPPDLATGGIDLAALPVIRAPHAIAAARACDHLLRSGAFGLVVVDLDQHCDLPAGMQSRLAGLARHHQSALVFLTRPATGSRPGGHSAAGNLGGLVSLRAKGTLQPDHEGRFRCTLTALRDKRHGPGWTREEVRRGPAGLC